MSQITIQNQTANDESVRVAVYKKPIVRPGTPTIAWQIVDPPPAGQSVVVVPADYTVFGQYSDEPNNPDGPQYTTNMITFNELTARFEITAVTSPDRRATGARIEQTFDDLVMNEVRVKNQFRLGVWGHIQKDGVDVYPAQVIWPGGLLVEDLRSKVYVAVVNPFTHRGGRLVREETSLTEAAIPDGGTATVTGSMWKGYAITVD
ncbi:MAG: hypothetical protein AAGC60_18125 [Acidobacteriota bacterium]